jgi:prepilin-type N-terminal cleavage/methylation domain-containing protein
MASNLKIKGFTLLESIVVLAIFITAIFIATQIYFNLMRSAILAQSYQLALDNFRFGAEKIWSEIKNGSEFRVSGSSISFNDRRCRNVSVYQSSNNLYFSIDSQSSPLFDDKLVELENFEVFSDTPKGGDVYFQKANKIIVLHYKVKLKTKTTEVPLEIWQAVAPSNSILVNKPCP